MSNFYNNSNMPFVRQQAGASMPHVPGSRPQYQNNMMAINPMLSSGSMQNPSISAAIPFYPQQSGSNRSNYSS